ncbi:MAG TPA: hypothetical protein VL424_02070 [Pararobbsia sp.]|jgi:hypothetical protein|nr:hypothetical protein [Pararobbsia sp.]
MNPTSQSSNVLDIQAYLAARQRLEAPIDVIAKPRPVATDSIDGAVLVCQRDMLETNAFKTFASRIEPAALLDLRPAPSMRFIDLSTAGAFRFFNSLGMEYVDIAGHIGKYSYSDAYWKSEQLASTLTEWIDKIQSNGRPLICLFGTHEERRQGRPTVAQALERSKRRASHSLVSHYRSGLLAM